MLLRKGKRVKKKYLKFIVHTDASVPTYLLVPRFQERPTEPSLRKPWIRFQPIR